MPKATLLNDPEVLAMALKGYEQEFEKMEATIREIRERLGRGKSALPDASAPKRRLSAAARKRIAMAQRKRWAEHRRRAALAAKAG